MNLNKFVTQTNYQNHQWRDSRQP